MYFFKPDPDFVLIFLHPNKPRSDRECCNDVRHWQREAQLPKANVAITG